FRYEAEIWYRLNHPNVLRLYGLYLDGPALYMVSPWQQNGPLSLYIKANPTVNKLTLLRQVADALAYLHSNDPVIIHGDIKGQNVLISDNGSAILCDFGLSMILSEIAGVSATPSGVQDGGSTRYMAPELMQGDHSKTCLSDTYAYAMLMIEVFSGSHPFPNLRYDASLVAAIMTGQRPACPFDLRGEDQNRNARLWRLIQICWHANPQFRPVMSGVNDLMQEIIGDDEMRQCVLKDFVILGRIDLGDYLHWVAKGKFLWQYISKVSY
ncbi:kinase-like protein, partial [Schizopora paradoxa]